MTAYERILSALQDYGCKVLDREPKARAQCPRHGSRGLTLSVRRLNDRAVVTCFAGCEDVDVLAALGLAVRDLFDGPPRPDYVPMPRRGPTPWEEACRAIGLHRPPDLEHVLDRMVTQQRLEATWLYWAQRADEFLSARVSPGDAADAAATACLARADVEKRSTALDVSEAAA